MKSFAMLIVPLMFGTTCCSVVAQDVGYPAHNKDGSMPATSRVRLRDIGEQLQSERAQLLEEKKKLEESRTAVTSAEQKLAQLKQELRRAEELAGNSPALGPLREKIAKLEKELEYLKAGTTKLDDGTVGYAGEWRGGGSIRLQNWNPVEPEWYEKEKKLLSAIEAARLEYQRALSRPQNGSNTRIAELRNKITQQTALLNSLRSAESAETRDFFDGIGQLKTKTKDFRYRIRVFTESQQLFGQEYDENGMRIK